MFETTYHFDKWKEDKEGEYFKILGKFDIDFTNEILLARTTEMKSKRFNEQPYNYANNKASVVNNVYHAIEDADNYAGQPNAEMFDAYRYNDDDRFIKFRKVAEWFELDKTKNQTWKFHDQKPNQQLMFHIDNLPGEPRKERIESKEFKYARDKTRFLVFLADWGRADISIWQSYTYTMESRRSCYLGMVNVTTCNMEWFMEKKTCITNYRYCNRKDLAKNKRRK